VLKPNVNDASTWKQRDVSQSGEKPVTARYMSAEDCVDATKDAFKNAIEKLIQKGPLDVQLGFTPSNTTSSYPTTNQAPSIHKIALRTPTGNVLGFVWLVKGSISQA
jgi:hypothetical protein